MDASGGEARRRVRCCATTTTQFPVRPGTEKLPLAELVDAQCYRLAHWRQGGDELNYRRFFDVTTLAAVRVEDPEVFDATHALLVDLVRTGALDGLRIDHPDGLADPRGYLARLADATGDAWVVAEKILEGHEQLPEDWRCAGTTGYDMLLRVGGVFVDPSCRQPLTALAQQLTGDRRDLAELVEESKRLVVEHVQAAEVNRLLRLLVRLLDDEEAALRRALSALLVGMDRYRAYIVPGELAAPEQVEVVDQACQRARASLAPADHATLGRIRDLVVAAGPQPRDPDAARELMVRFQQTCGPVMAKAIEDTAFYRYVRLTGLNEVGGDPAHVGVSTAELHDFAERLLATWPTTMTTLSTHDTKRSEDVRARLARALREPPASGRRWLDQARELAAPHRDHASTPPRSTSCGRRPSAPGRSATRAAPGLRAARRSARPSRTRPGRSRTRPTRRQCGRSSTALTGDAAVARPPAVLAGPERRARPRCTSSARSCSSCSHPAFRTSTRAPSSSTCPSSTPTTAARSTSPSDAAGSRRSTAARRQPTSTTRSCSSRRGR